MAGALLLDISQDERERAKLRSKRMYETDQISNILTAEARGEARGEARANTKWQGVIADKDAALSAQAALIAELRAQLGKE
ncbi:MAG: hypothetical protein FWC89_06335 [Defluviitaleaceae bacterium]|nr:hypothetical protein [Defluviitaleaceae bacterium]